MADIVRLGSALQQAMSKADHSGKQMYQLSLQVLRVPQAAVYPLMLQARQEAEFCTGAISLILHLCASTPGDPVPLLEARLHAYAGGSSHSVRVSSDGPVGAEDEHNKVLIIMARADPVCRKPPTHTKGGKSKKSSPASRKRRNERRAPLQRAWFAKQVEDFET